MRALTDEKTVSRPQLPEWLRHPVRENEEVLLIKRLLREKNLHTVCQSAGCPNITECFRKPTATFLILGEVCTRHCRFCGVSKGRPADPDPKEPVHIAQSIKILQLKHAVITSVTRDDLPDGGADQFYHTLHAISDINPSVTTEALIPDFMGDVASLEKVLSAPLHILNHNLETVPSLYSKYRPEADFERSLNILSKARIMAPSIITKTGLMLGLGEKRSQMIEVFNRLAQIGCDALTMGQYLAPSRKHPPVVEYIPPSLFDDYREAALAAGIRFVHSAPHVRSSYNAAELMNEIRGVEL